jgi:hypothetical protein
VGVTQLGFRAAVPNLCVADFRGRAWGHSKSSAILHDFAVSLASPAIAQFLPLSFAISIICVKWQSTNNIVFIQVLSLFLIHVAGDTNIGM